MRREFIALLLLAALVTLSLWNIHTVEKLSEDILTRIELAESAAISGDKDAARKEFEKALQCWLGAKSYTHIFIRHPEIDSCTDAFYEAYNAIDKAPGELGPSFDMLRYHLKSIAGMEQISLGNIF